MTAAAQSETAVPDLELAVGLHHRGDPGDPVLHDPLHTGLHGHRGRRTADTRAVELDGDDTGVGVHPHQGDVTAVGLDGRPDDLEDLFHLGLHVASLVDSDDR